MTHEHELRLEKSVARRFFASHIRRQPSRLQPPITRAFRDNFAFDSHEDEDEINCEVIAAAQSVSR